MIIKSSLKTIIFMLSLVLLISCAERQASSGSMEPKALFEKRCSRCHSLDRTNKIESAEYWKATVQKMKKKFFSGISAEDANVITDYLTKTKTTPAPGSTQGK
jgi:hypothetical protein